MFIFLRFYGFLFYLTGQRLAIKLMFSQSGLLYIADSNGSLTANVLF